MEDKERKSEGMSSSPPGEWKAKEIVALGEKVGKDLAKLEVTSRPLRRLLGAMRKIEARGELWFQGHRDEVVFLIPSLVWAEARNPKLERLRKELEGPIKQVESYEGFKKLLKFVESIVAYHKKHGGKD